MPSDHFSFLLAALIHSVSVLRFLALFLHRFGPHWVWETHSSLGLSAAQCCSAGTRILSGKSCTAMKVHTGLVRARTAFGNGSCLEEGVMEERCLVMTLLLHGNNDFSRASLL